MIENFDFILLVSKVNSSNIFDSAIIVGGISAIVAIITVILNFISHKQKLKAEIIGKARIEWLQNAREISVEFLNSYTELINTVMTTGDFKEHRKAIGKYNNYMHKLKLHYPLKRKNGKSNKDHEEIVNTLNELEKNFKDFSSDIKDIIENDIDPKRTISEMETTKLDSNIEEFIRKSSIYFKKVWEQAKQLK